MFTTGVATVDVGVGLGAGNHCDGGTSELAAGCWQAAIQGRRWWWCLAITAAQRATEDDGAAAAAALACTRNGRRGAGGVCSEWYRVVSCRVAVFAGLWKADMRLRRTLLRHSLGGRFLEAADREVGIGMASGRGR